MESDEFIKSCVENLVPNPSESEGENGCDVLTCFRTFSNILFDAEYEFDSSDDQSLSDEDFPEEIFSNSLFEEEIISTKIDPHHFDAEYDFIESILNHDSSIISSSSKIDSLLDEFTGELTLLKSIPPGIDKTDCYHENDIHLIERLLYDNSSPRPPEEFVSDNSDADIESFFPSPIPVEDSDSHMKEIDLPFTPDDPMPSGIEEDNYDSERDVLILEELLDNYSLSLLVIESYHFDIPSFFVLLQNHQMMKDNQENDKIKTKPDKNGKREKARQYQRPITVKKTEKEKKIQSKGMLDWIARDGYGCHRDTYLASAEDIKLQSCFLDDQLTDNGYYKKRQNPSKTEQNRAQNGKRRKVKSQSKSTPTKSKRPSHQNGNNKKSLGRDSKGGIIILLPVSFEEHVAVQIETKARTLLLQFGGNEESKKIRKTMLKQEFSEFSVSKEEGLHKGYDRSFEIDVKGGSSYGSRSTTVAPTHSAFIGVASTNTKMVYSDQPSHSSSITYTSAHSGSIIEDVLHLFVAKNESTQQLAYEDFEQVDQLEMEELDIKWQMAMLSLRINMFQKKTGRKINFNNINAAGSVYNAAAEFAMMGISPKGYLVPMLRCVGPLQTTSSGRSTWDLVKCTSERGPCWRKVHALVPRCPKTLMTSIMAPMSILLMGNGHPCPSASSSQKIEIHHCSHRLFHEVDRGEAVGQNYQEIRKEVYVGQHCVPVWAPSVIVTENRTQFVNDPFKGWCESLNIKQMNTAVAHPQENGLVERANKSLIEGMKVRLGRERMGWVDELSNVLWAHRTSLKQSNSEMSFSLTYESEAVITAEI
nr:reverse transcriptase domain-containing protein [Tanacetum cinerariifolium]